MKHFSFTPFPSFETERFRLRKLEAEDEQRLFRLRSDKKVNEFIDRDDYKNIEDAHDFIKKINSGIETNENLLWGIADKESDQLIGTICLWNIDESISKAEVGFELMTEEQGKGIMNEILPQVLNFGFDKMNLKKIEGFAKEGNVRSINLMKKHNFKRDTELEQAIAENEKDFKHHIYSLCNEQ